MKGKVKIVVTLEGGSETIAEGDIPTQQVEEMLFLSRVISEASGKVFTAAELMMYAAAPGIDFMVSTYWQHQLECQEMHVKDVLRGHYRPKIPTAKK
jgi:hypothetical protein